MVGERVCEGGAVGGAWPPLARAVESRERIRIRVDISATAASSCATLLCEGAHARPLRVGDPVRSVGPIVHPSKDRLDLVSNARTFTLVRHGRTTYNA